MNRRGALVKFMSLLCVAAFLGAAVLSCGGGGGGGGGLGPVTFSSPDQAAAMRSTGIATMAVAQDTAVSAITFGTANIPAFAPSVRQVPNTDKIATLDPRLKTLLDKMKNQLQAPAIKSAMKKASQLSASLAPVNTTLTSADGVCMDGGSITVTGTDDSTVSTTVYDVTITFNNCRDYVIDYTELSGSMRLVENTVIGSSSDTSLTVTNFSEKIYSDSLYTFLSSADVLNGSFSSIDDMTSGSNTASGSYSSTDYVGQLAMSFTFSGLRDDWIDTETLTTPATGTIQDTVNGTFSFIATDTSSGFSAGFTFGMTDFTDQITYNADGTTDEWWDGSIGMSWNPPVAGCLAGTITFTTQVDDPMHYSSQDLSICPVSGTLTANNATIQFGTSGAVLSPAVKVTVGTVSTTYTDCHSLGGGSICTM